MERGDRWIGRVDIAVARAGDPSGHGGPLLHQFVSGSSAPVVLEVGGTGLPSLLGPRLPFRPNTAPFEGPSGDGSSPTPCRVGG